MGKSNITFIAIICLISNATSNVCNKCVRREKCQVFGNLSLEQQEAWQKRFPCSSPQNKEYSNVFGFAIDAKGDYVCCSNKLLDYQNSETVQYGSLSNKQDNISKNLGKQNKFVVGNPGLNANYNNQNENSNTGISEPINQNNYNNNRLRNQNDESNPSDNNGYGSNLNNPQRILITYGVEPGLNRLPNNYFQMNPYLTSNPSFDNISPGGQCAITSFPPKPETGCCGREASDTDRIVVPHTRRTNHPAPTNQNPFGYPIWPWTSKGFPRYGSQFGQRVARSVDNNTASINIDTRIAGGKETNFEQFPWTALLRATFTYNNNTKKVFDCGGSLISSRYVLTAGHCVFAESGKLVQVEVFLSEYDKRTFPVDCKTILGQGKVCIKNIVMNAEDVILHPLYDDSQLSNDIALIRLQGDVLYTNYIRPICLPSIDIDTPDFFNLRLAVAGWGSNGRHSSNIKQSTIVNLVPQEKCWYYYPNLSRRQVCAAGYSGEDTCKGDSGGPLMTVYRGKYEVVGVVSGKRADSPCGTAVPSLYTNVYHYLNWIYSNIKN